MRQRIDLQTIYARAVQQIEPLRCSGTPALTPPETVPVTLEHFHPDWIYTLFTPECGNPLDL